MNVPQTIFEQLGGGRFALMTGSNMFIGDDNTLRMKLAKNASKANRLEITLNGIDLYDMRFYRYTAERMSFRNNEFRIYPEKVTEIKTINDVYCDQLQEIFTDVTGLYTRI